MHNHNVLMSCCFSMLALFFLALITVPAPGQVKDEHKANTAITNTITSAPTDAPGEKLASEPIKGVVVGADPKQHKVVIYARGGDTWFVQPTAAEPLTDIGDDGKWDSDTHGATDNEFVALVVKSSYKPKERLLRIPRVGGDILAKATWPLSKRKSE